MPTAYTQCKFITQVQKPFGARELYLNVKWALHATAEHFGFALRIVEHRHVVWAMRTLAIHVEATLTETGLLRDPQERAPYKALLAALADVEKIGADEWPTFVHQHDWPVVSGPIVVEFVGANTVHDGAEIDQEIAAMLARDRGEVVAVKEEPAAVVAVATAAVVEPVAEPVAVEPAVPTAAEPALTSKPVRKRRSSTEIARIVTEYQAQQHGMTMSDFAQQYSMHPTNLYRAIRRYTQKES